MASLTCDLGETEHILGRNTLDLFICSHLQITLLHDSLDCNNLEKLVTAGFWITRGNGLSLSARLYLDAFDGLDFSLENFADGLSNMLCTSKLWSQLSLKASRINTTPNESQLCRPINLDLALSFLEPPSSSFQKTEHVLRPTANVYDVKPPSGVPVAFLGSVELTLSIRPLPSPQRPLKTTDQKQYRDVKKGDTARYNFRCQPAVRYEGDEHSLSDRLSDFLSQSRGMQDYDTEMLDLNQEDPELMLFPEPEPQPTICSVSIPSNGQDVPSTPPSSSISPLDLVKLIDASLRHAITGARAPTRSAKRPTISNIKLAKASPYRSLADISPALFRPGYMKAIAARAPLISRIASSLSTIASRSRSRSRAQPPSSQSGHSHHVIAPSTLHPPLWHLLQKRKWPTTPLEPLDCDDISVFERCERDKVMILDSDREQDDGLREEEGDGEVMLEDLPPMNEDEEDLFSSIEGTPWSSQGWADHGMLEEDEAGEELLLGGVSVSPNWEVGTPCWRGTMERLARVEESMCHGSGYGVEGLEDVDVQMLF